MLPDFNHPDENVKSKLSVTDILAHRYGLATQNTEWMQEYGRLSLPKSETMPMFSSLKVITPLRSKWLYSNCGYAVAALMIEKVPGQSWGEFLEARIFEPLGLKHTVTTRNPDLDNVSQGYLALPNGPPYLNERPRVSSNGIMAGAAGVQSCVADLLVLYKALLNAEMDQSTHNRTFRVSLSDTCQHCSALILLSQTPISTNKPMVLAGSAQSSQGLLVQLA